MTDTVSRRHSSNETTLELRPYLILSGSRHRLSIDDFLYTRILAENDKEKKHGNDTFNENADVSSNSMPRLKADVECNEKKD